MQRFRNPQFIIFIKKKSLLLATLLFNIAAPKFGLIQAVGADPTVIWDLAAWTLPAASRAPALSGWGLMDNFLPRYWLNRRCGWLRLL